MEELKRIRRQTIAIAIVSILLITFLTFVGLKSLSRECIKLEIKRELLREIELKQEEQRFMELIEKLKVEED